METYREKIDEIDEQMAHLFEQRMDLVLQISKYKKENNLPVLDLKRQEEISDKTSKRVEKKYQKYYQDFIENVMRISRELQENE